MLCGHLAGECDKSAAALCLRPVDEPAFVLILTQKRQWGQALKV